MKRHLEAPRELVWECWSDPELLCEWWGPRGFAITEHKINFRNGGKWLLCLTGRGRETWFTGKYIEIEKPQHIVSTHSLANEKGKVVSPQVYGMDGWPDVTDLIVDLADDRGQTMMTVRQTAPLSLALAMGVDQAWSESFEKLAELLERLQAE